MKKIDHEPTAESIRMPLEIIGQRLKNWREENGMKISEVASQFGVATSTWCHWENGRRFPSGDNLAMLVEFTGIPIQFFFCPTAASCKRRTVLLV